MEAINRIILGIAVNKGIEKGSKVRVDCTVCESNIHHPTDSSLLWDSVRVLCRLTQRAKDLLRVNVTDHCRRAKKRSLGILNAKNKEVRTKHYRDLLKVTKMTMADAVSIRDLLTTTASPTDNPMLAIVISTELDHYIPLAQQVIEQTERRVIKGEKLKACEKIVSIFEPHTDIIVKDRRETHYGHKLCLTTGKSGLITDCIVLDGNPADSTLSVKVVERQRDIYGRPPRQVAFDGGFASKDNLATIKGKLGVKDVAFSKRRGLKISDMAKSTWVYKKLHRFRAGIEGGISFLKRCFGLGRCLWRGLASFKAYTWASVLSANLLMLARHAME